MIHTVFFDCGGTLISGKSTLLTIAEEMDKDKSLDIFQFLIDSFMEIYLDENPPRFYSIKEILTLTTKVAAKEFGVDDISHRAVDLYRHQHLNNDYLYDDTIPIRLYPLAVGHHHEDGVSELMVKFDRAEVTSYILASVNMEERFMQVTLTVTGELNDGTPFEGSDTSKSIMPMPRGPRRYIFPI